MAPVRSAKKGQERTLLHYAHPIAPRERSFGSHHDYYASEAENPGQTTHDGYSHTLRDTGHSPSSVSKRKPRSNKPTMELLLSAPSPLTNNNSNGSSAYTSTATTPASSLVYSASPATSQTSHSPSPDSQYNSNVKGKEKEKHVVGTHKERVVAKVPEIIDLCDTDSDNGVPSYFNGIRAPLYEQREVQGRDKGAYKSVTNTVFRPIRKKETNLVANKGFEELRPIASSPLKSEESPKKGSIRSLLNGDPPVPGPPKPSESSQPLSKRREKSIVAAPRHEPMLRPKIEVKPPKNHKYVPGSCQPSPSAVEKSTTHEGTVELVKEYRKLAFKTDCTSTTEVGEQKGSVLKENPSVPTVEDHPIQESMRPLLNEGDFDLSVDMESDIEDSLGIDFWREDLDSDIEEDDLPPSGEGLEYLGYTEDELRQYLQQVMDEYPSYCRLPKLNYLHQFGIKEFLRKFLIEEQSTVLDLLLLFGVLLSKEQRQLDDRTLLPLLKSAIVRHTRYRRAHIPNLSHICMHDVVSQISSAKSIMVLTGAGISTSCGIPDFRSRDGLYSQLQRCGLYDLDDPQQMFDMNYFEENPHVFYSFAHKIYPSNFEPSPCHRFIKALEDRGKLCTNYTQNIDTLENKAGIKKVMQCHGSFATASCINCRVKVPGDDIKDDLMAKKIPLCKICNTEAELKPKKKPRKKKRKKPRTDGWESEEEEEQITLPKGIMKPDITFFGEKLTEDFDKQFFEDVGKVSLLLIIGTSLKVRPVSEIVSHMKANTNIIVINKQPITHIKADYQLLGNADVIVEYLASKLGYNLDSKEDPGACLPGTEKKRKRKKVFKRRQYGNSGVITFEGAEGGDYVKHLEKDPVHLEAGVFDEYTDDDSDTEEGKGDLKREMLNVRTPIPGRISPHKTR